MTIPEKNAVYVKPENYKPIKEILESGEFFPVWIYGISGIGKTELVEQVCADLGKNLYRINFTTETDESDLIGSWRLENGNTVFVEGPVTKALKEGAILLLDELDAGHFNKILVLQSILEGKGLYIKQLMERITPAPGFNIIATGNTKGKGDDSGVFVGTSVLNGAMLDRFPVMFEHTYPYETEENEILKNIVAGVFDGTNTDAVKELLKNIIRQNSNLVKVATKIRSAHKTADIDETISTRSLIYVLKYAIIKMKNTKDIDIHKLEDIYRSAFQLMVNRFDDRTSASMMKTYELINPSSKTSLNEEKAKFSFEEYTTTY